MYPNASIHTYGLKNTIKTKGEPFMDLNQRSKAHYFKCSSTYSYKLHVYKLV